MFIHPYFYSSDELKELKFFSSVNWDDVLDKKVSCSHFSFAVSTSVVTAFSLTASSCTYCDVLLCVQVSPPLIPPRGEVNAADAFDIGNFDDDDTRGIKVSLSMALSKRTYMYVG